MNLIGGGSFSDQPDQLVRISSEMAFFTEDGGSSPGIHVLNDKKWGTLVQAGSSRFLGDETTGIAVSPNREFIFFCFQEAGILYQLSRIDGKPF